MKLNKNEIRNREVWEKAGIRLFDYDPEVIRRNTEERPEWVHFGCGNIFKVFEAALQQKLLNEGLADTGIIVAEGFDYEIIDKINRPHDELALAVTLRSDGSIDKEVIGSITDSIKLDSNDEAEYSKMKAIFRKPSLKMCTFTITEKGYNLKGNNGEFFPAVLKDFEDGPEKPQSYIGKITALCYERFLEGSLPFALVSTDNCSHNGDRLKNSVLEYAERWEKKGLCREGFCAYLCNPELVSFPWSMIDKITPRPDAGVKQMLKDCGFEDYEPVTTAKKTFVAPFVNAEETQYLIIEDHFPNGHPKLEAAGVIFTARETVDKVERMKVCTCLNPLHTAMSVFGCMLGYKLISEEMKDDDITGFIRTIGYKEGLPVVTDPGIIDPKEFIDTVVGVRLPNPFMPDTPQRIATDTSQKLPIRFGVTISKYLESDTLDVHALKCIPLVHAGWCRYLMGIDDNGDEFEVSPDPLYELVSPPFRKIKLGANVDVHELLGGLLCRKDIFGVDLYEAGLGELVEKYFAGLISGKGAVRKVLHEVVSSCS